MGTDIRHLEITSQKKDLVEPNKEIWTDLGIKQSDNVLFFPTPNVLVPIAFAKFMNKRKVTFVDASEINVSTLISLAADMRLSNVTVKLATPTGKFPIADSTFDLVFSDWGYSHFIQDSTPSTGIEPEALTKELLRILKPEGRIAALDENGPPIMFPCPPEIQSIRNKIDLARLEKYTMGRRIYGLLKSNGLKNIRLKGYSRFVTRDDGEKFTAELNRRIQHLDLQKDSLVKSGLTPQEIEKYKQWLKIQAGNDSFIVQFNSILTVGQK
jgi:SAM-dependent methyltransferase